MGGAHRRFRTIPGHPILADLIGWLKHNAPSTERLTLVHGAYRTGNVLIHEDHVSAILDWELQVIGDPMYDIAYMLTELNREGTELLSNVVPAGAVLRAATSRPRALRSTRSAAPTTSCSMRCAPLRSG